MSRRSQAIPHSSSFDKDQDLDTGRQTPKGTHLLKVTRLVEFPRPVYNNKVVEDCTNNWIKKEDSARRYATPRRNATWKQIVEKKLRTIEIVISLHLFRDDQR